MDYLALYRKYRPKDLDEVVGQSEIKKILASSVKNNTITHAYLFSGPRGTGKTTMAKILAKMVNCLEPVDGNACNKCEMCNDILNSNDIIEIDAASNNGVDEIRDLREKANLVPNKAKYKVYIIDEVHMLTTQAFNALLKTLEEPPKHVIFILATTEYYKIPLTITSRCQKFQFNKLSNEEIVERLKEIAKKEKIEITEDALFEIAKLSDGGMRDSINFLDQLRSFNSTNITVDDVYEVCGSVSNNEMVTLFSSIKNNKFEEVTAFFEKMDASGKNYTKFLEEMIEFLKDAVLFNKNVNHKYIKSDLSAIQVVNSLLSIDEIFYFIESVNEMLNKLKNVSRQSVVIITNFLLIMNNINKKLINVNSENKQNNVVVDESYDMAFQFTSSEKKSDDTGDVNVHEVSDDFENIDGDNDISNSNENKEIIINNAFAVANKEIKISLQKKIKKIEDYFTDKKYKIAAGALVDANIEVAGEGYIIFSVFNDAAVEKVYSNYKLCNKLINEIFNQKYNFVVLSKNEWDKYRDEYVVNFKNGKKYILKELKNATISSENKIKTPTVVDKLFELVGEENIEFK